MFFFCGAAAPQWATASSFLRFLNHTQRRITVGRTPLDERSASHRDLYLTTHNTHNRQTSMPPVGFEPTVSAGERPQSYTLGRAATGTGVCWCINCKKVQGRSDAKLLSISRLLWPLQIQNFAFLTILSKGHGGRRNLRVGCDNSAISAARWTRKYI